MTTHTIYLVRHGENEANLTKQFSHRVLDHPLNAKGIEQAHQTAAVFQALPIDAVYTSPLARAVQTARIIAEALHLPITVVEAFREINVGELDGRPFSQADWDLHDRIIGEWIAGQLTVRFPAGEDYLTLCARMQAGLQQVLDDGPRHAVVVGHGGIFTATLPVICPETPISAIIDTPNHNCSITELELEQHAGTVRGRLCRWADWSHLEGNAAQIVLAYPVQE